MTEYFRIEGKNLIDFDRQMVSGTAPLYCLSDANPPGDLSRPLTRQEIIQQLPRLPLGVRGHALNRGMSMVSFPFRIQAGSDAAMEQALHNLKETLNDAQLHVESEGARGTQARLRHKTNAAVESSYKTIYCGYFDERRARDVLGSKLKEQYLADLELALYMEPMWRPSAAITLGPNQIYCPSFEEDGNGDGRADNWTLSNVPVLAMESTIVLHGAYSQKVTTNAIAEGIRSAQITAPAAPANDAIAYVWVCRPAAGSDIEAILVDDDAPATRAQALYSTSTTTVTAGGYEWRRLECMATNNIVPGNNHSVYIRSTAIDATVFYVDKAYWKWDTTTIPDEWCDHWLIYNHYDTPEGAAHEGHQNYFDVADLKGTDEARLELVVEYESPADEILARHLTIGRRCRPDLYGAHLWLEAEDSIPATNWADAVLARCSAGSCVSDAANASGFVSWTIQGADPLYPNIAETLGDYDVYGVVLTDDPDNTYYRLSYGSTPGYFYNQWVRQSLTNKWELLYLGEVRQDPVTRSAYPPDSLTIQVEYEKDAADTAKLDFIWLIPKDEPETRLHFGDVVSTARRLSLDDTWVFERTMDFDMQAHERPDTPEWIEPIWLQGDEMTLTPEKEARLYFLCESFDSPDDIYEAHGAETDLQMIVSLAYLPQYQTPLD